MNSKSALSDMKVVAIGGGSGLSVMLRGLKQLTKNISVIVTVADDGGSSGILRHDMNILPPGDIRNCITALSERQPLMEELFSYRFKSGSLSNQSFGNLFLAAMTDITGSFEMAINQMSSILKVKGEVMPVTLDDVSLRATLLNGKVINGESAIPGAVIENASPIEKVELVPPDVRPFKNALDAIASADMIIIGPGSLYTSLLPNFLVGGIAEAVYKSQAKAVYICNVMTQRGETDGYKAYDHVEAFERHIRYPVIDYCIANSAPIPQKYRDRYKKEYKIPVELDEKRFEGSDVKLVSGDLLYFPRETTVRHDYVRLAALIEKIACMIKGEDK